MVFIDGEITVGPDPVTMPVCVELGLGTAGSAIRPSLFRTLAEDPEQETLVIGVRFRVPWSGQQIDVPELVVVPQVLELSDVLIGMRDLSSHLASTTPQKKTWVTPRITRIEPRGSGT